MADQEVAPQRSLWTKATVAVVTGGNKGVGFATVKELAKHGLTVVLTARDPVKGIAAVEALESEEGLENIHFHPLEVTSSTSAESLAVWLKDKFGGIDILVNNAGVGSPSHDYEPCVTTIDTNYFGIKNVTKALLPLLRDSPAGPRIVNVSSMAGALEDVGNAELREKMSDVPKLTEEVIDSLAKKYLEVLKAGHLHAEGWFSDPEILISLATYRVSKICLNAYTRMLARDFETQVKSPMTQHHHLVVFVNAATPGFTLTDMSKPFIDAQDIDPATNRVIDPAAAKTPEQGADTIVWLALLPREECPMGRLFLDRKDVSY